MGDFVVRGHNPAATPSVGVRAQPERRYGVRLHGGPSLARGIVPTQDSRPALQTGQRVTSTPVSLRIRSGAVSSCGGGIGGGVPSVVRMAASAAALCRCASHP